MAVSGQVSCNLMRRTVPEPASSQLVHRLAFGIALRFARGFPGERAAFSALWCQ
jgi:hypothetical protein